MSRWFPLVARLPFLVQQVDTGVLPALYAATSPEAQGGAFYGPSGFAHLTGGATEQRIYRVARSTADTQRLWHESEQLAKVTYTVSAGEGSVHETSERQEADALY
jgi:hypothetical protein